MQRQYILKQIDRHFRVNPVIALLGPRQCGKTTVARQYIQTIGKIPPQNYFDLENPRDIARLADPMLALSQLSGLIVIDEIQSMDALFPCLRVLVDNPMLKQQRYLILGSASEVLLKGSAETLAGRISHLEMTPFSYPEVGDWQKLWIRGGFPKAYLAHSASDSQTWRKTFIKTFLEKDIPRLGIQIPFENLRRFWMMLAHRHGYTLNASDIARSLGLSGKTIQHYADILTGTYMIRQLKPWFENIDKRQVKAAKIFFRNNCIFHTLSDIQNFSALQLHPKLGNSWECFALEQIIRYHQADSEDCYFWSTHQGAEIDLLLMQNNQRVGFEIKYNSAPTLSKSMRIADEDLKLDKFFVIYPGDVDYALSKKIKVVGLKNYLSQD